MDKQEKTATIKGIKVHSFSSADALIDHIDSIKGILVAVNAEKTVNATDHLRYIINNNTGYCDGAGAVKAMRRKGLADTVRIPGCDLWLRIVERFHKTKTFYLVGSKPQIIKEVVDKLTAQYPDLNIVGYRDGFIADTAEHDALINDIARKKPDVVFVAMGSPRQEFLMEEMANVHPDAIYQGLGGSFDVYSGHQQRAPRWWQEHNLEFAYRFVATPKRIFRLKPYLKYALLLYTNRL